MTDSDERYRRAADGFARVLDAVRPEQWAWPTPCAEWNVRQLVNHMTRGNLNYALLADGGSSADFLRLRDRDALGGEPLSAYAQSAVRCAGAFAAPGVLDRLLDYPLGKLTGRQALAVRTADSVIHTWDLARAVGADETLDAGLVGWIGGHLDEIYGRLAETPVDPASTNRFFAPPVSARPGELAQNRLLRLMGRVPDQ